MKSKLHATWLFALPSLLCVTPTGALENSIEAFSTLGSPPLYDGSSGVGVRGATATTFTPYTGWANQFTATQSGALSSVDIAVTYPFYAVNREVDVRLALDVDDFLPPPTSLASGTLTAAGEFNVNNNSILTVFTPAISVSISAGQKYWLILTPHDTQTSLTWNHNNAGIMGRMAATFDGSNWGQNPSALLEAFRINVIAIPEPSSAGILLIGSLLLLFRRARPARQATPS